MQTSLYCFIALISNLIWLWPTLAFTPYSSQRQCRFMPTKGWGVRNDIRVQRREEETSLSAVPLDVITTMYNQALMTNPLETKLATGGILALAGDCIAQSREEGDYDVKRAGAFVSFDMMYRALQCALFPEIIRVCDGHYLGSVLSGIDTSVLATMEQTMGTSSQSILRHESLH